MSRQARIYQDELRCLAISYAQCNGGEIGTGSDLVLNQLKCEVPVISLEGKKSRGEEK